MSSLTISGMQIDSNKHDDMLDIKIGKNGPLINWDVRILGTHMLAILSLLLIETFQCQPY